MDHHDGTLMALVTFAIGYLWSKTRSLERRIEQLETPQEEPEDDVAEEADSQKLDGNHRLDKPHFDAG